jgi:spore coat protein CotH
VRSSSSETAINEAVALELLGQAGLATQEATAVRLSVNDSEDRLRLVMQHPGGEWAESTLGDGKLYKAESTGDWSYRGDDPETYDEVFDQEAGPDGEDDDLTPLTEFLRFINETDDVTFAAEIADRLDVEAFARYLAIQEDVFQNFDDIDGPGNNAYLYEDPETGQFTVVAWDHNFALTAGPGGVGGGEPAGGLPAAPPEGFEIPECLAEVIGEGGPGAGAAGFGRINPLVERFTAIPEYAALVEQAKVDLAAELDTSGAAAASIDAWEATLIAGASDLVDAVTITADADAVRSYFTTT